MSCFWDFLVVLGWLPLSLSASFCSSESSGTSILAVSDGPWRSSCSVMRLWVLSSNSWSYKKIKILTKNQLFEVSSLLLGFSSNPRLLDYLRVQLINEELLNLLVIVMKSLLQDLQHLRLNPLIKLLSEQLHLVVVHEMLGILLQLLCDVVVKRLEFFLDDLLHVLLHR